MTIRIRNANKSDIAPIQAIAHQTWRDTYEGLIAEEVQTAFLNMAYADQAMISRLDHMTMLVAEADQQVVGFANFSKMEPETESATLAAIYILPAYQNRNLGTRLLEKGLEQLPGLKTLCVDVEKDNEKGKRFYESKGFRLVEEYTEDFYGHQLQTVKMILEL